MIGGNSTGGDDLLYNRHYTKGTRRGERKRRFGTVLNVINTGRITLYIFWYLGRLLVVDHDNKGFFVTVDGSPLFLINGSNDSNSFGFTKYSDKEVSYRGRPDTCSGTKEPLNGD